MLCNTPDGNYYFVSKNEYYFESLKKIQNTLSNGELKLNKEKIVSLENVIANLDFRGDFFNYTLTVRLLK